MPHLDFAPAGQKPFQPFSGAAGLPLVDQARHKETSLGLQSGSGVFAQAEAMQEPPSYTAYVARLQAQAIEAMDAEVLRRTEDALALQKEQEAAAAMRQQSGASPSRQEDVIDLCDSDGGEEAPSSCAQKTKPVAAQAAKQLPEPKPPEKERVQALKEAQRRRGLDPGTCTHFPVYESTMINQEEGKSVALGRLYIDDRCCKAGH